MSARLHRFVVIRASGKAENFDRKPGLFPAESPPYLEVLSKLYDEVQTAGSNHDSAVTLLFNGKVVIEGNLHKVVWDYGWERRQEIDKAAAAVNEKHTPDWYRAWIDEGKKP